jgi:hypothetical protein
MLLDFLSRAACGHARWLLQPDKRASQHAQALQDWY